VQQAIANGPPRKISFERRCAILPIYKRLDWWDVGEGRLPNPDVQYPLAEKAVSFICTRHACSPPIFDPEKLLARVDKLLGVR
jgi:hypothetical protein